MMPELNERQKRYMLAAHRAAPTKEATYNRWGIGEKAGFDREECDDFLKLFERPPYDFIRLLVQDQVTLLARGREVGRALEEEEQRRQDEAKLTTQAKGLLKKGLLGIGGAVWTGVLGFVTGFVAGYLTDIFKPEGKPDAVKPTTNEIHTGGMAGQWPREKPLQSC